MEIRKITDALSVSPQICAADVAKIKAAGFVAIVNNRPDGEEVNQPWNDDIEEEAKRLGIPYHYFPIINRPYAPKMIAKMREVQEFYDGPIFCFCRTGTRCTQIWAYSQIGKTGRDDIISLAADAGYDLSNLADELT